jgi:hypothetical protein
MRTEQVTCDVCGAQKKETNHWFIVALYGLDSIRIVASKPNTDLGNAIDCCGESCVLREVSELMKRI